MVGIGAINAFGARCGVYMLGAAGGTTLPVKTTGVPVLFDRLDREDHRPGSSAVPAATGSPSAKPVPGGAARCAVGRDVNAFRWDSVAGSIIYEPRATDELAVPIPDVVYVNS